MAFITDFMDNKNLTIDDLIEQLSEIREAHGNLNVVIPVEIKIEGESAHAFGIPRKAIFNEGDNTAEIELKNYFEV